MPSELLISEHLILSWPSETGNWDEFRDAVHLCVEPSLLTNC